MKNKAQNKWPSYQLIDVGNGKKLERFGDVVLIRPETAAYWSPNMKINEWEKIAHASFEPFSAKQGKWVIHKKIKPTWQITYPLGKSKLVFNLQRTAFKHIGVFPEQATNWEFIYKECKRIGKPKVLNLFAYTGGATLAANAGGADVTHVDSIKQVVNWASSNMESSGLKNIRWVVEDALKFVQREKKRGRVYQGIILDPPSFGLGTKGERWKLNDNLGELLKALATLLDKKTHFFVLNTYSIGLTPLAVSNFLKQNFPLSIQQSTSEMCLISKGGYYLPLGVVGRLSK